VRYFIPFLAALIVPFSAFAVPAHDFPPQIEVINYEPPSVMKADGKFYLAYELHLTNFDAAPRKLVAIDVMDNSPAARTVARFNESKLPDMLLNKSSQKKIQEAGPVKGSPVLDPGSRTVAFLWLEFDDESKVPAGVVHTLSFESGKQITIPSIPVKKSAWPVLAKPFSGKGWLAINGPSNNSLHRRTVLVISGHPYIGQRTAIDWMKIGENGMAFSGDPKKNESYFCYNQDVLAVAEGTVAKVLDGVPENTPATGDSRAVTLNPVNAGGNQVAIDLGGNRYALYGHLIPGSIRVKEGDKVKAGQVIAKVGNSGNSTSPHLHLQVSDRPDFLAAEGIPYGFAQAQVRKIKEEENPDGSKAEILPGEPQKISGELVLENDLVDWE
jgi:biotin carboxyl carrier protein